MMNTTVLVKVGVIPGAINEYVLEVGSTVAQALELANLSASGYDVRMDSVSVTVDTVIPADAKMIILCKMIKGNASSVVLKVGIIPGAIQEYVVEEGVTVEEVLRLANLSAEGYDIRLDSVTVSTDDFIEEDSKMLILAKCIKGNSPLVKVGVIPGAINEYALESGTTVAQALELAGLSASGYDVRMDSVTVSLDTVIPEDAKMIILAKQIKGNNRKAI